MRFSTGAGFIFEKSTALETKSGALVWPQPNIIPAVSHSSGASVSERSLISEIYLKKLKLKSCFVKRGPCTK
jgi:hypothetical protein